MHLRLGVPGRATLSEARTPMTYGTDQVERTAAPAGAVALTGSCGFSITDRAWDRAAFQAAATKPSLPVMGRNDHPTTLRPEEAIP